MGLMKQRFVIIQLALLFLNFLYKYYLSYFPLKFVFSFEKMFHLLKMRISQKLKVAKM